MLTKISFITQWRQTMVGTHTLNNVVKVFSGVQQRAVHIKQNSLNAH